MISLTSTLPAALVSEDTSVARTVVLLHGLGLHAIAMSRLAHGLEDESYRVVNLTYPSRSVPLEELASAWLPEKLYAAGLDATTPFDFVTHSMGGIIVRLYRRDVLPTHPGRVVMIAPPNQGTPVVDRLTSFAPFRWFTGVNGRRLGTRADSLPRALGPWPAKAGELGVIAGDHCLNPLFGAWIGEPNDGKVAVSHTKLEGMSDFIVLPHSHTWLQWRASTLVQVKAFLRSGKFMRSQEQGTGSE